MTQSTYKFHITRAIDHGGFMDLDETPLGSVIGKLNLGTKRVGLSQLVKSFQRWLHLLH